MKIAFFHHTLRLGSGIDTVIYELANRLALKDEVTVFCFKTDYEKKNCRFQIKEVKSKFTNTTKKMMTIAPIVMDKIGTLISDLEEYDVVNTHLYPANYIVRNISHPVNLVTEWSIPKPYMFSSILEKMYIKWSSYINKIAAKQADVVLAPCEFVKNWILKNYSINAITIFLDGVNFETFNRISVTPHRVFELFPSLEGKKIILFVGRITESKNIHTLIEIFSRIRKKNNDIVLILIGDHNSYPNYFVRLKNLLKEKNLENDVIFTGIASWDDLPSFYAACTVYATCSLWEGFLRAESYAFGKPIICFNTGANKETVKDGETGFLIENLDRDDFEKKLYELLTNEELAKKMGEKGYTWSKQNLDFNIISERFRTLCKEFI